MTLLLLLALIVLCSYLLGYWRGKAKHFRAMLMVYAVVEKATIEDPDHRVSGSVITGAIFNASSKVFGHKTAQQAWESRRD